MSSAPESDRLRDIADDLRVVYQMTEELAGVVNTPYHHGQDEPS